MQESEFQCALVGAASFDFAHFRNESFERVIAVDGGFASLERQGAFPDFALGDFDSLGYVPDGVPIERHPSMKDDSDTALALGWAYERGFSSAAVYGALGLRLDHTIATFQALVGAARRGMKVVAVGEGNIVAVLSSKRYSHLEVEGFFEGTISVFSASDRADGVSEFGLKYEVDKVALTNDVTLGLSNEFIGEPACISVEEGDLIVVMPRMPFSAFCMKEG